MGINMANVVWASILLANLIFAIVVVFVERKRPAEMLAWLLLLYFVPVIGFVFYLFFGQKIFNRRRRFKLKLDDDRRLQRTLQAQVGRWSEVRASSALDVPVAELGLVRLNLISAKAVVTTGNDVTVFSDGHAKFEQLFADIAAAEHYIHAEYFIWRGNDLGRRLVAALAERAAQGIDVRIIVDDWGCKLEPRDLFKPITDAGGQVYRFLPVSLAWAFNANYRNHRKIVVIDGRIGYTGGMNVGDEYLGLRPTASPWRDTHVRIVGSAVLQLQARFIQDYWFVSGEELPLLPDQTSRPTGTEGTSVIQIVCSGPDSAEPHIKQGFVKMIHAATDYVYIQTPYFVPDESMAEGLKLAAASGVDVRIMIPGTDNNAIVHFVTLAYAGELLAAGVRFYEYNGFLHSKTILIDDRVVSIGTTNMDVRSFSLNFEVNAFIYDAPKTTEYREQFEADILACRELTWDIYRQRGVHRRFFESVFRLFAPLM